MTLQEQIYKEIITKVAEEQNLPYKVVERTYKAFWLFIRTVIQDLPLKEELTEEEFNQLKTCINVPSLGKLGCTYDRYKGIKKRFQYIKHLKENENKED